jgi:hypothetical protein
MNDSPTAITAALQAALTLVHPGNLMMLIPFFYCELEKTMIGESCGGVTTRSDHKKGGVDGYGHT